MRNLHFVLALVVAGFLVACGPHETKAGNARQVDFIHQASDLKPDPDVVYGKLPNGVRYAVMHNETPTKTAALRVRIATGSLNETDNERGIAHFLEHMAFNGSENIPEGEMVKKLERLGLAFGADTNASTGFDQTVYMLNLPSVDENMINQTLGIMRETVDRLSLKQDALDRERGVVQAEKRRMDAPGVRASLANFDFFTKDARLFSRLPIGTDKTLKSIDSTLMRQYYEAYYQPQNTFVVLVGDIDPDFAAAKIAEYFGDWKAHDKPGKMMNAGTVTPRGPDVGYFVDPDVETEITLATIKPYVPYKDTVEGRKKRFIEGLGNRILNRRLSALAQKPDAVFISGGVGVSSPYKSMQQASLSMTSRPENWKKALTLGDRELRKALKFGFTKAELAEQIANSRKAMQVAVQTAGTRRTNSLASGILGGFANESVFTHPSSSLERFESYADKITTDEVWTAFKKQWSALDKPLLFLQTSEVLEHPKQEIMDAYDAAKAAPVEANAKKTAGKFAYTDFGTPGKVVAEKHIKDADAWLIRFANNVTLNFKHTDFEKETVRVTMRIGDGALSEPRKDAALQFVAGTVMNAGGLEAHSADEVRTLMAGKAVSAGFGIGTRHFSLSGSTVKSDITDEFNYLMAKLTHPGYRPEAKARYTKSIESWYPTLDSTPGGVAARDVSRILHSNDPRFGIPSLHKLLAPETTEVKAWLTPFLQSGAIDITVVGDIDKDTVIKQVARTFGTLVNRKTKIGNYPDMTKLVFPKSTHKPIRLSHSGDANRALLQMFWPAPDGRDIMVNRRLNIIRQILQNRLTDVIREEEGAAYSPSAGRSGSRWFPGYGYMSISLGLRPEKVAAMRKKVLEIANDLQAGNITDDEFTRATKPILESLDTSLEQNSYWMAVISNAQNDTRGLENFRTRNKAYHSMTLADIKPLAKDIFKADKAVTIEILPQR